MGFLLGRNGAGPVSRDLILLRLVLANFWRRRFRAAFRAALRVGRLVGRSLRLGHFYFDEARGMLEYGQLAAILHAENQQTPIAGWNVVAFAGLLQYLFQLLGLVHLGSRAGI